MSAITQDRGFEEEFAEELEQLEYYSHEDYVEVKVVNVEQGYDDQAKVEFSPPVGDDFTKEMDVPLDPSAETEFTELLDEAGRNYANAGKLVGDRVPAKHTDSGWEIYHPEPDKTVRQRATEAISERDWRALASAFVTASALLSVGIWWPLAGLPAIMWAESEADESDPGFAFVAYVIGVLFWLLCGALLRFGLSLVGLQMPIHIEVVV